MWGISKRMDFEQSVLSELEGLLRTCQCLTVTEREAGRRVQEAVVETYRNWNTLRHEYSGRAPVYAVLTEQFLKNLPAGSRLNFFYPSSLSDEDVPSNSLAAMAPISSTEFAAATLDDIRLAMSCLSPAMRLVTALSLVQGFSRAEIADIVGVPIEIVRTWLRQGRWLLHRELLTLALEHKSPDFSVGRISIAGGVS